MNFYFLPHYKQIRLGIAGFQVLDDSEPNNSKGYLVCEKKEHRFIFNKNRIQVYDRKNFIIYEKLFTSIDLDNVMKEIKTLTSPIINASYSKEYGIVISFFGFKNTFYSYFSQSNKNRNAPYYLLIYIKPGNTSSILIDSNYYYQKVEFFNNLLLVNSQNLNLLLFMDCTKEEMVFSELEHSCKNFSIRGDNLFVGNNSEIIIYDNKLNIKEKISHNKSFNSFESFRFNNQTFFSFNVEGSFYNNYDTRSIRLEEIVRFDNISGCVRKRKRELEPMCFEFTKERKIFDPTSSLIYKFPENQILKHLYIKILEKYKCYPQNVNKEQNFSAYIEEMEKKFLCKLDYNMVCNYFIDLMNSTKKNFDHVEDQNTLIEYAKEFIFYFKLIEKVIDDKTLLAYYEKLLRYSKNLDEITLLLKEFLVEQNNFETDLLFEFFKKINLILKEDSIKYYSELKYFLIEIPLLKILRKYSFGTVKKIFFFFYYI